MEKINQTKNTIRIFSSLLPAASSPKVAMDELEFHHIARVLRTPDRSHALVFNGKGSACLCELRLFKKNGTLTFLKPIDTSQAPKRYPITLYLSIPKPDAMSWILEKAVELNIQSIVPIHSDYTLGKPNPAKWRRIIIDALKQSESLYMLAIAETAQKLSDIAIPETRSHFLCAERLPDTHTLLGAIFNTPTKDAPAQHIGLWIGPEGGWSENDLKILNSYQCIKHVTLGPNILRTETAAIAAMTLTAQAFQFLTKNNK